MRVSLNWLKDYVDINLEPQELAQRLTMVGIPVEHVEYLDKGIKNVVVGLIKGIESHPNADKLSICTITTDGEDEIIIVTGASNVKAGQKIPVATEGAYLPGNGGIKIKRAKLRGVESNGMLCSADELELDTDLLPAHQKEGIYILPEDAPLGENIVNYLGLNDWILELELTPNRADCFGIINVAREIAAITNQPLKMPEVSLEESSEKAEDLVSVEIMDGELCPRYTARVIKGIEIKPSPEWMQQRLRAAGIRPINNVVDVTNYVMFEMNQPLHAFDYELIADKKIIVRRAQQEEIIRSLDGVERNLTSEMLVIADGAKAVAIAGVMGGEDTEVTENTTNILLEAAAFKGTSIRRTSQALNLRSESSMRFEKGIDIEAVDFVGKRAAQLINLVAGGRVCKDSFDCYVQREEKQAIALRLARVNELLGTSLSGEQVTDILEALKLSYEEKDNGLWTVVAPSYRRDITIEMDLIEEVARIYGYDNIPTTLPFGSSSQGKKTKEQKFREAILTNLSRQGMHEIVSYSFVNPKHLDSICIPQDSPLRDVVVVQNPLSEEQGIMRTSMLPGILVNLRRNSNRRNKDLSIFELGKIYFANGFPETQKLPMEIWYLTGAVVGKEPKTWLESGKVMDFYYLKGILENLLDELGVKEIKVLPAQNQICYHPGRVGEIVVNGETVGIIGELHPDVLENYDLEDRACCFEINLEKLLIGSNLLKQYEALPKYPTVTRDLALVVDENVLSDEILSIMQEKGQPLLKEVKLFDIYRGNQITTGKKSMAYALTYQAMDRTLVDEEVNAVHESIRAELNDRLKAELRM